MKAFNLLPPAEPKKTRKRPALPLLAGLASALVVVAILGGGFYTAHSKTARENADLAAARAQLASIPKPQVTAAESAQLSDQETLRTAALQSALSGRIAWDRVLREVSAVLPDDVWLTDLVASAPASTDPTLAVTSTPATDIATPTQAVAPAETFRMDGNAYTHDAVARLLARLALVPDLDNVSLVTSQRIAVGKREAVQFTVSANMRAPGGSS
jgi:Tfp pilus assembly protein PilN